MGQKHKRCSRRSTRTVPPKFQKGDMVTFSDSCPPDFRQPFVHGPTAIVIADETKPIPYGINLLAFYRASDLKLVKRRIK